MRGGGLVCESFGQADLLSDHFYIKPSKDSVDLLLTFRPSICLVTFTLMSNEEKCLMLDLDPYEGTDPLGMSLFD